MHTLTIEANNTIRLSEKDKPGLKPNEALIKINAVALNHRDQFIREGKYPGITAGVTLGSDACGEVVEVADENNKNWIGKTVLLNPNIDWGDNDKVQSKDFHIAGTPTDGFFAEYVNWSVDKIIEKPKHLSDEKGAALPLAGMTAYRAAFHHGDITKNDKVLISGVGGGVAQFAFQFALAAGAEVYVSSSSDEKIEKCINLGAKAGFNYKSANWVKEAKSIGGFDVIIDSACGDQMNSLISITAAAGRIVFYGATLGKPRDLDVYRMFWNQITLQGSTMANDKEFKAMVAFVDRHTIEPIVDSTVPFKDIESAFDKMKAGKQFGKLVAKF